MSVPAYQSVDETSSATEAATITTSSTMAPKMDWEEVWYRRKAPRAIFYPIAAVLFVVVDLPWLLGNGKNVSNMIENIQGSPLAFRVWAAIPVYLALPYLVSRANTRMEAFLLGLSCYAVYDFTNLSTLDRYSWGFALADSVWGGVISSIVFSILSYPPVQRVVVGTG